MRKSDKTKEWVEEEQAKQCATRQQSPTARTAPSTDDLVRAMLRDYRFKRVMLLQAEEIFWSIPPEVRIQLFKDAAVEMLKAYKIKDIKQLSRILGRRLQVSSK